MKMQLCDLLTIVQLILWCFICLFCFFSFVQGLHYIFIIFVLHSYLHSSYTAFHYSLATVTMWNFPIVGQWWNLLSYLSHFEWIVLVSCLSLLGQISGELGLEDVSDLTSWDNGQISVGFCSLQTKEHINKKYLLSGLKDTQSKCSNGLSSQRIYLYYGGAYIFIMSRPRRYGRPLPSSSFVKLMNYWTTKTTFIFSHVRWHTLTCFIEHTSSLKQLVAWSHTSKQTTQCDFYSMSYSLTLMQN